MSNLLAALSPLARGLEKTGALLPGDLRVRTERRVRGWLEARRLAAADAAVVSFGKSGRTWLRVMVSRVWQQRHGLAEGTLLEYDNMAALTRGSARALPVVLFTHDNYLGDWTGNAASKADYRHTPTVVLVRHPADVAVSQYHQWRHRMRGHKKRLNRYPLDADLTLFDFVMGAQAGLPKVIGYMNAWATALPTLDRGELVRYEDLRADTARELGRVLAVLGTDATGDELAEAVDYASVSRMRAREAAGASDSGRLAAADTANPDSFKTRRAKVGGYRDDFSAAELAAIDRLVADTLDPALGYHAAPSDPAPATPGEA